MLPVHVPVGSHIVNSDDDEESAFVDHRGAVGDDTGISARGLAKYYANNLWSGALGGSAFRRGASGASNKARAVVAAASSSSSRRAIPRREHGTTLAIRAAGGYRV